MSLTGLALALLAVAALTGWLDVPLQRLGLRPWQAVLGCLMLLAARGWLWRLPLAPLAAWLPPGSPAALTLDPGAFLLPLVLLALPAFCEGGRRLLYTALDAAVVGAGLLACFLWLPGEPAQLALFDPAVLYAVACGLAACLLAGSEAGAVAAAVWAHGLAEAGRAAVALWRGTPVLTPGAGQSLLLAALVALAGAELVFGAWPVPLAPQVRRLLRRP